MQIRDKKTLLIFTLFPIILIFAGLALATIQVIKSGVVTEMNPFIYPNTDGSNQIGFHANSISQYVDETGVSDFMKDYFVGSESRLGLESSITIDVSGDNKDSLANQVKQFDQAIFDLATNEGKGPYYAQFFLNSLNSAEAPYYSGVLMLNATSSGAPGVWGAYANKVILEQYLFDSGLLPEGEEIKLTFINHPFPLSKLFQGVVAAAAGTTSALLITIAWMMVSDSLITAVIEER